tara:strand:+ start:2776 stop:2967 length:192 start_codon:yes stop_codon:yes gene_type:complete
MEKTSEYWKLHKEIYQEMLFDYENNFIQEITSDPKCGKARALEARVCSKVEEELRKKRLTSNS